MSWRGCVVCIVGDLSEDAVVSHWWTETNILELLKYLKIKLVKKVDKTVTHLICSRSAYANMVPEGMWQLFSLPCMKSIRVLTGHG